MHLPHRPTALDPAREAARERRAQARAIRSSGRAGALRVGRALATMLAVVACTSAGSGAPAARSGGETPSGARSTRAEEGAPDREASSTATRATTTTTTAISTAATRATTTATETTTTVSSASAIADDRAEAARPCRDGERLDSGCECAEGACFDICCGAGSDCAHPAIPGGPSACILRAGASAPAPAEEPRACTDGEFLSSGCVCGGRTCMDICCVGSACSHHPSPEGGSPKCVRVRERSP